METELKILEALVNTFKLWNQDLQDLTPGVAILKQIDSFHAKIHSLLQKCFLLLS